MAGSKHKHPGIIRNKIKTRIGKQNACLLDGAVKLINKYSSVDAFKEKYNLAAVSITAHFKDCKVVVCTERELEDLHLPENLFVEKIFYLISTEVYDSGVGDGVRVKIDVL